MMKKNQDRGTDSSFVSIDTQPMHSQSLPPDKAGGNIMDDCDTQYIECTLPLEDVHLMGDGINTQILDVDGQTQVLDPFGEPQVLDDWNTVGVSINDGDEESDKTEFLGDTQVLSDDDCVERGSGGLFGVRSTPNNSLKKDISRDAEPLLDAVSIDEQGSGSIVRGFTFVRAASLRASGRVARNRALNEMNTKSFSPKRDDFLLRQTADKVTCQLENGSNQQNSHVDFAQMNVSRHKNLQKVGSSTVRKLFTDDEVCPIKQADNGNKPDKSGFHSFAFENVLEELNYVNSEEPGDLSQANALKVVDKFIELNVVDGDSDAVLIKSTGGKGKLLSSARGVKSLAKKCTTKSTNALSGTYYWDDNLEDEGGGEFFQKNKVLLLSKSNRKHSTKKGTLPSCLRSKSRITCQKTRDKKKQDTKRKSNADDLSDSSLMSDNLRVNRQSPSQTKASSRKNLIKDMDEKMLNASEDWKIENGTDKIVSNTLDVGNTQMAADAKQNLCVIGGLNGNEHVNGGESTQKVRATTHKDEADKESNMLPYNYRKETCLSESRVLTRQSKKARTCVENWTESNLASAEQAVNVKTQLDKQIAGIQPMKAKAGSKENGRKNIRTASKMAEQTKEDRVLVTGYSNKPDENFVALSNDPKALVKCAVQEQHVLLTPIANRTRRSLRSNRVTSGNAMNNSRDNTDAARSSIIKTTKSGTLFDKGESNSDDTLKLENHNSGHLGQSGPKRLINKKSKTHSLLPLEASNLGNRKSKRLKTDASAPSIHNDGSNNNSSACGSKRTRTCASKVEEKSSGSRVDVVSVMLKHSKIKDGVGSKNHADIVVCLKASPEDSCTPCCTPSVNAIATPLGCKSLTNDASPVCMGDEYTKKSCRTNLLRSSLKKELNSLMITIPELTSPVKETRKRKDMVSVRVLFSQHLDPDIIKQQKKILARLGATKASSMSDATHFVTDMFVRTRNMLEAIASGKPVVTHLWLESCAQASCFIDERNYILRDAKKEKEFGFNMEFSLARACQNPILRGQRVLITPNTKPGIQVLANLVKAAHGLVMERLVRSLLTDKKLANDLLVLSCKEDYDMCLPFLENGASVYSSELLLNGIVTQRLEYERYRLFTDNVKRTRSTTWLKRNNQYVPTNKSK